MNEIQEPEKKYCIQSNLVSRAMYYCPITERKLLAVAIATMEKMYFSVNGEKYATYGMKLKVNEILSILGNRRSSKTVSVIGNAVKNITQRQVEIETESNFQIFNWFMAANYDKINDTVELVFNPIIALTIVNKQGYTKLDFLILGQLQSQYSLGFYELAKSYQGFKCKNGNKKGEWYWDMTVEEVRKKFQLEKNEYPKIETLIQSIILRPIKSLNAVNPLFEITPTKIKKGRNTVGFRFLCSERISEKKIAKNLTYIEKKEIEEENTEGLENATLKFKYSELFNELKQQVLNEQQGFKNEFMAGEIAIARLREKLQQNKG